MTLSSSPALTVFNGRLQVSYRAGDGSQTLAIASSVNGEAFSRPTLLPEIQMAGAPSMTTLNDSLFIAYRGIDAENPVWVASSDDGTQFSTEYYGDTMQTDATPALATFDNRLYMAYRADLTDGRLVLNTSSTDGKFRIPNETFINTGSAPSMAVAGDFLFLAYQSADLFLTDQSAGADNQLRVTTFAKGRPFHRLLLGRTFRSVAHRLRRQSATVSRLPIVPMIKAMLST